MPPPAVALRGDRFLDRPRADGGGCAASSSSWLKEDDAEDISDGAWNQTDGHADNPAAAEGAAAVEAHGAVRVSAPSEAELEAGRV